MRERGNILELELALQSAFLFRIVVSPLGHLVHAETALQAWLLEVSADVTAQVLELP